MNNVTNLGVPRPTEPTVLGFARDLLAARRLRNELLFDIDFADIEWFILVDLFVAAETGLTLSLSDLYNVIRAPRTTVLRAIARLVEQGVLVREPDLDDGRRKLVHLTQEMRTRLSVVLGRMRDSLYSARAHEEHQASPPHRSK